MYLINREKYKAQKWKKSNLLLADTEIIAGK